jgi:hypothetical protein
MSRIESFPIDNDQIIFRDGDEVAKVENKRKNPQLNLIDDVNILKSDNLTSEFLFDEEAQQKLENGQFYQGDIVLMEDQLEILKAPDDVSQIGTRTGILSEYYRWPKNRYGKVVVPFVLSNQYSKYGLVLEPLF